MLFALELNFSAAFQGDGAAIAVTGMLIVFVALTLITVFIASLPRILESVAQVLPESEHRHARPDHSESLLPENEAVLAAIGFVLHTELHKQLKPSDKS